MNWKLILIGGLLFYVGTWVVSFITGPLIHEGVLDETYRAHQEYWRPELNQDPPNLAALMPRWIGAGLVSSFVMAALYGWIRPALSGAGWKRGAKYGIGLFLLSAVFMLGWSGIFNLPDRIWVWWALEGILYYPVGGILMGWISEKVAPVGVS